MTSTGSCADCLALQTEDEFESCPVHRPFSALAMMCGCGKPSTHLDGTCLECHREPPARPEPATPRSPGAPDARRNNDDLIAAGALLFFGLG